MLRLWLISFGLLFVVAEGMQWLGHMAWLDGLALPLPVILLGGVGLAIASNRPWLTAPSRGARAPSPEDLPATAAPPPAPGQPSPRGPISFEIPKPRPKPQLPFEGRSRPPTSHPPTPRPGA